MFAMVTGPSFGDDAYTLRALSLKTQHFLQCPFSQTLLHFSLKCPDGPFRCFYPPQQKYVFEYFFSFYKMTLLECSPSGGSVAAKCTNCCIPDENSSLPYMRQLFWNAFLVDEMPGRCKLFNLSHCITRRGDLQPYKPASWDASFWRYGITES